MNWIYYHIENEQITNPSVSRTPYDVLTTLLYGNCNIYKHIVEHDFYKDLSKYFDLNSSFDEKLNDYKGSDQHEAWIEYLTRVNLEVNHVHRSVLNRDIPKLYKEQAIENAIKKDILDYNDLVRVDQHWDKLFDYDFAFKNILNNRYSPHFDINNEYFPQNKFNENTDQDLLKIAYFLNNVYIDVMDYFLNNPDKVVSVFNPIKPNEEQKNRLIKNYNESKEILKNSNEKIKLYINNLENDLDFNR